MNVWLLLISSIQNMIEVKRKKNATYIGGKNISVDFM